MAIDFKGDALTVVKEFAEKGNMDSLDLLVRYYAKSEPETAHYYMEKIHNIMTEPENKKKNVEHCLAAARKLIKLNDIADFNVENKKASRNAARLIKKA